MKINLRKAKALQTNIYELIQTLDISTTVDIGEFDDAAQKVAQAADRFFNNFQNRNKLWQVYYSIRAAVAQANASTGISTLLAELALAERIITDQVSIVQSRAETTNLDILAQKQGKLRQLQTSNAYRPFDNISSGILSSSAVQQATENLADFRKQKQNINDKLLELNIKTEIELDKQSVAVLTANKLI